MTEPAPEAVTPSEENPVAETAGHEDHSNPDLFRGEEAEAPRNPTVEEYTQANGGVPPTNPEFLEAPVADPDGGVE